MYYLLNAQSTPGSLCTISQAPIHILQLYCFTKLPHPIFAKPRNATECSSLFFNHKLNYNLLRKPISQPPNLLQPTPPRTRILPRLQTLTPHLRENTIIQRQISHVTGEASPGDDLLYRCRGYGRVARSGKDVDAIEKVLFVRFWGHLSRLEEGGAR